MKYFVSEDSIVRKIWGKADTVLFIFAGASAEFALNKSVDWLYFTGKIPSDPIGRLFSTVSFARNIIFSDMQQAIHTIDRMNSIHGSVEKARGSKIPAHAFRDVLFMLIHYSIASYELLERKLSTDEKEEVVNVFTRVGRRMEIEQLPTDYASWKGMYILHLSNNLERSNYTDDLYAQYKKHLGIFRYYILLNVQWMIASAKVKNLLRLKRTTFFSGVIPFYKLCKTIKLDGFLKSLLLPPAYKDEVKKMDIYPA
ncbi:MAG: DUF2236 domain-containing protein [Chitinophagaceae bacterium]|nr:DUF2236 domain-containing protein [Chitinophagaceae bacterium]MCW5928496.1 DUF2236 domain-containing protein [Chitinophagaceae bacterium]